MKYIACILFAFLIAACAHTSTTSAPVNIVGLWEGTVDNPDVGPPLQVVYQFTSDGQDIRGFVGNKDHHGEWVKIENFKMKGDKINFTTTSNTSRGAVKVKYKGTFVDPAIELSAKVERPSSPSNSYRLGKPSFRRESNLRGDVTRGPVSGIDQRMPSNMDLSGVPTKDTIGGRSTAYTLTIRKVQ